MSFNDLDKKTWQLIEEDDDDANTWYESNLNSWEESEDEWTESSDNEEDNDDWVDLDDFDE